MMNNTLKHRGPDSNGVYIKKPIALGFRRLSIIDLDDSANQPMLSNDQDIVIVFNGRFIITLSLGSDSLKRISL